MAKSELARDTACVLVSLFHAQQFDRESPSQESMVEDHLSRLDEAKPGAIRALSTSHVPSIHRHGRACPGHPRLSCEPSKTWMPGTRPGMTKDGFIATGNASEGDCHWGITPEGRRHVVEHISHTGAEN
jgi:hypothetical protein